MYSDDKNKKQLFEILSNSEKLVYLCGTGFSMSLGKHFYTWLNWIKESKKYLDNSVQKTIDEKLSIGTTNSLIDAADIMLEELKNCNKYNDFMLSTVGSVKAISHELKEAVKLIAHAGDLITTTNYDLSIEDATGLESITYNSSSKILNIIKNKTKNKIIHLHGAYCPDLNIDDIIANSNQYEDIVNNQGAQFIQNLIGTYPIIVVGCGGTVEDPNLKNFLQFSKKYLNLNIPYFYLYCKKDSIDTLPENMIPVCYGNSYEDLPDFMLFIAMKRMREHINITDICRVNPYIQTSHSGSAYSRMHYAAKYLDFIGRKDELSKLSDFLNTDDNFSWWMVTGEAGMGKSRLIIEWMYNLPSDWFGFFANIEPDKFNDFKPFSNTVVALDYTASRENDCAKIIEHLIEIFKNSSYKLKILLVERHYEPDKKDWFYTLNQQFKPIDKILFEKSSYSKNPIVPLEIGKLKYDEEKEYIKNYLKKYVNELNNEEIKDKYLKNINNSIKKIHKAFKRKLKGLFHRPLYLSIFIEVWIDKSGDFSIKNSEELLECYLEKEEKRWLERFNNNRIVLNTYLNLLALACVTELLCINDDNLHYQKQSDILYNYLLSEEQAGRRKTSFTDLFIVDEPNKKNPTKIDYMIEPLYPDIIREFIVLYYIREEESKIFAQTARYVSVIQLSMFLAHALDDFPKNEKFIEMIMTEPNEDCEYFDYFIGLIANTFDIPDYNRIINNLSNTSQQVTEDFGIYELLTWRKLAVVQSYNLYKKEMKIEDYIIRANKFTEFINKKFNLPNVKELSLEIFEIWFEGLYNSENIKHAEEYLISIKNIINKMPEEYEFYANAATVYCESYQKMLILHARKNNYDSCKKDIEIIEEYLNIFPNDEDIYNSYIQALSDYVFKLCGNQNFNHLKEIQPKLQVLYKKYNDEKLAENLAIIYANFYSLRINDFLNNKESVVSTDETLKKYENKITELLNKYPCNEHIVEAYVSIKSNFLITKFTQKQNVLVDNNMLQIFRQYHQKWQNNIDIIDALGNLIFIKAATLLPNLKNKRIFQTLLEELKQLEIKSRNIYKEYSSQNNELKTYIKVLENSIELQNFFINFS